MRLAYLAFINGRYSISSCLRFELSRLGEDATAFRQRINKRARDANDDTPYVSSQSDAHWVMGTRARHKGSVHSDIWRGPASDLAGLGMIGVYPAPGWWKTLVKEKTV
ncbi:hypothetical protein Pta6605_02100 [Pseudomonas amygdali pv. tabaci]|nr:hypothetical protein Pta6605_02100 [Pseudomonas amygdali pv. tabaci]